MSEQLSRKEKIDAILEMVGFDEAHHEHHRELLEMLSDNIIDAQYAHCMELKNV